jgi:pimeloyl-ACP methyl ester carboxylesterase
MRRHLAPSFMRCLLAVAIVGAASAAANAQDSALELGLDNARAAEVNGTTLTYIEKGSGSPLLLVHGAFADLRYWQAVMDTLAESHRVVAYSRRDFYPNPLDAAASVNPHADRDDLAALIEKLDMAPVHLVGHSGGGQVALALAAEHPNLVKTLTTIEGGFLEAGVSEKSLAALASFGPVIRTVLGQFGAGNTEAGTRTFLEYALGHESYRRWPESSKKNALQNAHTFGRRPEAGLSCADVAAIRAPALLLIGTATPSHNRAMMEGVQSCVPGIETVEIPGASHNVHIDNPAEFSRAVLDFVGRH